MGKREQNKAKKQRRILEAAHELFESQGFEKTTTAEISELAGVGTGTLYLYVSSKEELLFSVFAEDINAVWSAAFDAVERTRPVLAELLSLFQSVSLYHARQPTIAATYFLELSVALSSVDGLDEIMKMIFGGLERVLAEAQGDGRLSDLVDPAALAHNLFAIWNFVMMYRFSHNTMSDDEAHERLDRSLTAALVGLVP